MRNFVERIIVEEKEIVEFIKSKEKCFHCDYGDDDSNSLHPMSPCKLCKPNTIFKKRIMLINAKE